MRAEPFATLSQSDGIYELSTGHSDKTPHYKGPVNAVCDIIAATSRQRAVEQPDELCLHAASVQLGSALAVFPAIRRTGKSVLTMTLASRGHRVFGDDVIPIPRPSGTMDGIATGAPLRLRLPLPDTLLPEIRAYVSAHSGPGNRQYQYITSPDIAPHGTRVPIGALVRLIRKSGAGPELRHMSRGVMLKSILHQNFARQATGGEILARLFALAESVPAYELAYDKPSDAAALLQDRLGDLTAPDIMPDLPELPPPVPPQTVASDPDMPLLQVPRADLKTLDGEIIATNADMTRIIHLDVGAHRIWRLLAEPTSQTQAVDVLSGAFSDVPATRIATETAAIFARFRDCGLVSAA